jgi:hypothetical protein
MLKKLNNVSFLVYTTEIWMINNIKVNNLHEIFKGLKLNG